MKRISSLLVNSSHKTKPWWVFVSILVFVLIPFIIVWILCGEFNALDHNWLIAKGQSVWHGIVKEGNIDYLVYKYHIFYAGTQEQLANDLFARLNQNTSITSGYTFFSPIILLPLLMLFVFSICYPIIFNATKVSGLDIVPFSDSLGMFCLSFILSGLIPVWNPFVIYIVVRIIIGFSLAIATFFLTNFCVNKYLVSRDYGYDLILGYKSIDAANASAKKELRKSVEEYNKQKEEEPTYIDLPVEN